MFALPSQLISLLRHWSEMTGRPWMLPLIMPLRTYVLALIFPCAALVAFRQPVTEQAVPFTGAARNFVTSPQ